MENENSIPFGIGSVGKLPGYHHWLNPDDPEAEKKGFYKDLYNFMRKRGTPITKIPKLGGKELDLFTLYTEVVKQGGLQEVIAKKEWKNITRFFNFPKTCTNAGFTLRLHYMKFLFAYERVHLFGLEDDKIDYTPKKRKDTHKNQKKTETEESESVEEGETEEKERDEENGENSLMTVRTIYSSSSPSTPKSDTQSHDTQQKMSENERKESKEVTSSLFSQVIKSTTVDTLGKESDNINTTLKRRPIHTTRSVTAAQNNFNPFQLSTQTRDYSTTPIPLMSTRVMKDKDYYFFKAIQRELKWTLRNPVSEHTDIVLNFLLSKSCDLSSISLRNESLVSGILKPLTKLLEISLNEYIQHNLSPLYSTTTTTTTIQSPLQLQSQSLSISSSRRKHLILNIPQISVHSNLTKIIQILRNLSLIPENQKIFGLNPSLLTLLFRSLFTFHFHIPPQHKQTSTNVSIHTTTTINFINEIFDWNVDEIEEREREDTILNVLESLSLLSQYIQLKEDTPYHTHIRLFLPLILSYFRQLNAFSSHRRYSTNINLTNTTTTTTTTGVTQSLFGSEYSIPYLEQCVFHMLEFLSRLSMNPENHVHLQLFEEGATKNSQLSSQYNCRYSDNSEHVPQSSTHQLQLSSTATKKEISDVTDQPSMNNMSNNSRNEQKQQPGLKTFFFSLLENLIGLGYEERFQPMIVNILFNLTSHFLKPSVALFLCNHLKQTIPLLFHIIHVSPSLEVKVATILYNLSTISETIQILAQYIPHFTALVVNEDSHLNSNQTKDLISAVLNIIVERE